MALGSRESSENTEQKQTGKFRPGQSGNPSGKPKGARHKATIAAQALLDGEAENITRKAVELALGGDLAAIRLVLERIVPPRKESPLTVTLPALSGIQDLPVVMQGIVTAVTEGAITPGEGKAITDMLEGWRKAVETADLEGRVEALEKSIKK